jgi:hypothetical protein
MNDLRLILTAATFNARGLDLAHPVIHAHPGKRVSGSVAVRYTTRWPAAAVMIGAVATWMPRARGILTQLPLVTPIEDGTAELTFTFDAPRHPGTYHIIVAYGAEPDIKWLASGTNWAVGHPIWGDGNDFQQWSDSTLDVVRQQGNARVALIRRGPVADHQYIPSRVIDVVVE